MPGSPLRVDRRHSRSLDDTRPASQQQRRSPEQMPPRPIDRRAAVSPSASFILTLARSPPATVEVGTPLARWEYWSVSPRRHLPRAGMSDRMPRMDPHERATSVWYRVAGLLRRKELAIEIVEAEIRSAQRKVWLEAAR